MREIRPAIVDIDRYLEEAARAQQQHEADRWRHEVRPRAIRTFAERAATLTWSRALLKLVVRELYPDDLFAELIGNLDRVPRRRWPQVVALAVALRYSWRRDGLAQIVKSLHVARRSADDSIRQTHSTKYPRRRKPSPSKRSTGKSGRER